MNLTSREARIRSHKRIRKKVTGTAERPRLAVFRSNKGIYAQAINDEAGHTITSASTLEKEYKDLGKAGGNIEAAKAVGAFVARRLLEKGVSRVVFDRGGFLYHGRIRALAEAAREAGLKF